MILSFVIPENTSTLQSYIIHTTHLECTYVQHLTFGSEIIILGKIVAVSVDREAIESQDPYAYLRLFAFLEDGSYGTIEKARHLGEAIT